MSKVKLTLPGLEIPVTGKQVTFSAPCDCSSVECLQINGVDYCVVDALGRQVTGTTGGGVWATGAKVSVILDCEEKKAYLQNGNPTLDLIGAGMVNPNLLHNWYFGNLVDQRNGHIIPPGIDYYAQGDPTTPAGQTASFYTANGYNASAEWCGININGVSYSVRTENAVRGYVGVGYTIDRWALSGDGVCEVTDNGVHIVLNHTWQWIQKIENLELLDGHALTASVLFADGTLRSGTIKRFNYSDLDWDRNQFFRMGELRCIMTANTNFMFFSDSGTTDVTFKAIKLELGSTQTLAHQDADGNWVLNEIPDYSEELLKCCMSKADSGDLYAGNKKTPAAINAVSKSGDTMTGILNVNLDNNSTAQFLGNGGLTFIRNFVDDANYQNVVVGNDILKFSGFTNGNYFDHNILHTGNMEALSCGRIATGSYVGTGCCGPDYANVLTFGFKPALVIVSGWDTTKTYGGSLNLVQGSLIGNAGLNTSYGVDVAWSGNSVSWYYGSDSYEAGGSFGYPERQFNASGMTYHWFAIG